MTRMIRTKIRSIALRIALGVLNFFTAAALHVTMWRNGMWREDRWTKKP